MKKQPPEVFHKNGVLKIFTKFTEKHLYQGLFFNKVDQQLYQKRESYTRVSCKFCEVFKNTILADHMRSLLLYMIRTLNVTGLI